MKHQTLNESAKDLKDLSVLEYAVCLIFFKVNSVANEWLQERESRPSYSTLAIIPYHCSSSLSLSLLSHLIVVCVKRRLLTQRMCHFLPLSRQEDSSSCLVVGTSLTRDSPPFVTTQFLFPVSLIINVDEYIGFNNRFQDDQGVRHSKINKTRKGASLTRGQKGRQITCLSILSLCLQTFQDHTSRWASQTTNK